MSISILQADSEFAAPLISSGPDETMAFGARIVETLPGSFILALNGELGSGKTCFVQGVARALGITQPVTSPSFTIVNEYRTGSRPLYHIDLYRLGSPDEAFGFGFEEYIEAGGILAVEWAERAGDLIPQTAVCVDFEVLQSRDERRITLRGQAKVRA